MGQFKPMVKMMTTEPKVELKLKKGGSATFDRLRSEGAKEGFKATKKAEGGVMGALSRTPAPTTAIGNMPAARAMAQKKRMVKTGRAMKEGGDAALKKHASMPASKAHKGLKTGGVVMGQAGFAHGGIIKSTKGKTKMVTAAATKSTPKKTGDVAKGKPAGYKSGGKVEKFQAGGPAFQDRDAEGNPIGLPTGGGGPGGIASMRPNQPARRGNAFNFGGYEFVPDPQLPPGMSGTQGGSGFDPDTGRLDLGTGGGSGYYRPIGGGAYTPPPPMTNMPSLPGGARPTMPPRPSRPPNLGMPSNPLTPMDPKYSNPKFSGYMGGAGSPMPLKAYKKGGMVTPKGGGVEGNVSSSSPGVTNTTTGAVRKGNAGGFKEGGAAKKAFATGGVVDTGRPVAMPQGKKSPSKPVSISRLSGTFKKGGAV